VRFHEIFRRIVLATFGGLLATLGVSLAEAVFARAAAGEAAPALGSAVLAIAGVIGPLCVLFAFALGAGSTWLFPDEAPSLSGWIGRLRALGAGRPADVAALAPLAVLAGFAWATASAQLARAVLSLAIGPKLAGLTTAAGALLLGLCFAVLALAGVPPLRRALALLAESRPACLDPVVTGGTALVAALALFVAGMVTGTVSGEGGALGIWGIFKRPELDLRAVVELFFVALAAVTAQSVARPPRSPSNAVLGVLALACLAPVPLAIRAAVQLDPTELAPALERGAPLAKLVLPPLRRLVDRDGDGASARFGGGDCDDTNPAIGPGAEEILDDGIDQDCSGADLSSSVVASLAPKPEDAKVDESLVPRDLNVVLITVDTLRWDLGYAGYKRPVSPNIDALAARSTVFERGYSLASYTGKSIGPMLIGKYGSETDRNWGHFNKFGPRDTFLAERLQKAGVRTMGVHAHRYFDVWGGLERGFDVLDFTAAPPKDAPWDIDTKATGQELTDAAIALLQKEENTKGRFFMWVHYLDPHADYLRHDGIDFGKSARDLYDGEVAFTDRQIGRLLAAIDASAFGKRTAIVLTSDHGEAFGENNMFRHGFEVWETLVRVPLVVHVPGAPPRRVAPRRSLIDLVPTVLELMHLPSPGLPEGESDDDFVSGQSLLTDVYLPDGKEHASRDVLIDMPAGPYNDARRALIHGDDKLVVSGDSRFALYDLAADPDEAKNLAKDDAKRFTAMKDRYAALKARLREIKVTGKRK
jgi:arylsulfatase A-like enzyme